MVDLLTADLVALTIEQLTDAFAHAGDEDTRWEAKGGGGGVQRDSVLKAVAGLYNRDGGLLALGASATDEGWKLDGLNFTEGNEPATWLASLIRGNLRPAPECSIKTFSVGDGRHVVLLKVPAGEAHLTLPSSGIIYRREHGHTARVTDGLSLTGYVLARTSPEPAVAATPAVAMEPEEFRASVYAAIGVKKTPSLRHLHPRLRAAALAAGQAKDAGALTDALDKHAELTALLLHHAPDDAVTRTSLTNWHEMFEAARKFTPEPANPGLTFCRAMLVRVRALLGLCRRFELWSQLRTFADHALEGELTDIWASWLTAIAADEARALQRPVNAEHYRQPVMEAAALAMRLPALNPDELSEDAMLPFVVAGEFLACLIELDSADRGHRSKETFPAFAHFSTRELQPLAHQLGNGGPLTANLLPSRVQADILRLMSELNDRCKASTVQHGFWDGFADTATSELMQRHHRSAGT